MSTISLNWFDIKKIDSKSIDNFTMKVVDKQQNYIDLNRNITRNENFWKIDEIS